MVLLISSTPISSQLYGPVGPYGSPLIAPPIGVPPPYLGAGLYPYGPGLYPYGYSPVVRGALVGATLGALAGGR
ncbi:unnamed protein product [Heligmosomoides polygyrus]|uniref:Neuropeptide-like 4 n=1 Tax=Heligmosomoides polygyrus TaxID=6339 RepID=A0A183F6Z4_HELPZ|nr:unnamed protein product [Heligmosomoides polygyrus]